MYPDSRNKNIPKSQETPTIIFRITILLWVMSTTQNSPYIEEEGFHGGGPGPRILFSCDCTNFTNTNTDLLCFRVVLALKRIRIVFSSLPTVSYFMYPSPNFSFVWQRQKCIKKIVTQCIIAKEIPSRLPWGKNLLKVWRSGRAKLISQSMVLHCRSWYYIGHNWTVT